MGSKIRSPTEKEKISRENWKIFSMQPFGLRLQCLGRLIIPHCFQFRKGNFMHLKGISEFISVTFGKTKDGREWCRVKFLDEEADEFFISFVDADIYNSLRELPKKTPVQLTLSLVPGQKYFKIESVEVAE